MPVTCTTGATPWSVAPRVHQADATRHAVPVARRPGRQPAPLLWIVGRRGRRLIEGRVGRRAGSGRASSRRHGLQATVAGVRGAFRPPGTLPAKARCPPRPRRPSIPPRGVERGVGPADRDQLPAHRSRVLPWSRMPGRRAHSAARAPTPAAPSMTPGRAGLQPPGRASAPRPASGPRARGALRPGRGCKAPRVSAGDGRHRGSGSMIPAPTSRPGAAAHGPHRRCPCCVALCVRGVDETRHARDARPRVRGRVAPWVRGVEATRHARTVRLGPAARGALRPSDGRDAPRPVQAGRDPGTRGALRSRRGCKAPHASRGARTCARACLPR